MLLSCAPVNNINKITEKKDIEVYENKTENTVNISQKIKILENSETNKKAVFKKNNIIKKNISIIFSKQDNPETVKQFINIVELAVYKKNLKNISFDFKIYENKEELKSIFMENDLAGKVFIGPLNSEDTKFVSQYCNKDVFIFSFSSKKELAKKCIYLVNFFPENEMRTVFDYFPNNSKIALLFPENEYGFAINKAIDKIADQSNSVIINRASYNTKLTNAPQAIRELGKYELRKYELNRQKQILASKKDPTSKKRLAKLEKFKTTNDLDFTHIIIADYGLRLLQVAPLLPYYDIDPNIVQFVGTGAWDDQVFYDEPSLNGSIYPGIEFGKREELATDYYSLYDERFIRTSTLPFDLIGLMDFIVNNNFTVSSFYELLNNANAKFSGIDGNFYFLNNIIERDLKILKIQEGKVSLISK